MSDNNAQPNSGKRGPFRVGEWRDPFEPIQAVQIMQDGREFPVVLVPDADGCEDFAAKVAACLNACDGINPEAVPELVKACERAINYSENVLGSEGVYLDDNNDLPVIRAAIAKAKGGVA